MKEKRQAEIVQLIGSQEIETQEELTALLIRRGFAATQATVSRDIKELRLIKVPGRNGKNHYATNEGDREAAQARLMRIFVDCVMKVDSTGNLLVLRTLPGSAQAAAGTLDDMELGNVLGCIAGDDTILVVLRDSQTTAALHEKITALIAGAPMR